MNIIERMKNELNKRYRFYLMLVMGITMLFATQRIHFFTPLVGGENYVDFLTGFQFGLLCFIEIYAVYKMTYYKRILEDDARIEQLYLKEHDKRELLIAKKSGGNLYSYVLFGLLVAAVLSAYFSIVVFMILISIVIIGGIMQKGLRYYYSKKI